MRRLMTPVLLLLVSLLPTQAGFVQQDGDHPVRPRGGGFEVIHVYLDAGDAALAAYQLEVKGDPDRVEVVGIEGGEHDAFRDAPFYDPRAIQGERVVIGAFSTAEAGNLPTGRTRVASIHVLISKEPPRFETGLQVVATVGGGSIDAELTLERGGES